MKPRIRFVVISVLTLATSAPTLEAAATITFESIPGSGQPVDGTTISNQFLADYGVSFSLEGGGFPVLAKVGTPRTAFEGYGGKDDQTAPNQDVGLFFLTDDGVVAGPPSPLIISYATPVRAASGVILDIDGEEAWSVEARDASNNVVAVVNLGTASFNAGDGLATPWSFSRSTNDIALIRLVYTGSQSSGVGLAFDNFSPATVGEPPSLAIRMLASTPQVAVRGTIGQTYRLEYTAVLPTTNWSVWTNLVLPSSPYELPDLDATAVGARFYRTVQTP